VLGIGSTFGEVVTAEVALRRWKLLVALAGLAVLVAAGVVALWPRPERITRENFDRIKVGMSRAEVYAILGPPGDYSSGPVEFDGRQEFLRGIDLDANEPVDCGNPALARWWSDTGSAWVEFDPSDRARPREFTRHLGRLEQSSLDALLWRAKRQWRKWFPQ